jgi:hypothetical protein
MCVCVHVCLCVCVCVCVCMCVCVCVYVCVCVWCSESSAQDLQQGGQECRILRTNLRND